MALLPWKRFSRVSKELWAFSKWELILRVDAK